MKTHVTWNGPPKLGEAGDEVACSLLGGFYSEEYWRRLHIALHAEHRVFILQCLWKGINFCGTKETNTPTPTFSFRHTIWHVNLLWFPSQPFHPEFENKWSAFPSKSRKFLWDIVICVLIVMTNVFFFHFLNCNSASLMEWSGLPSTQPSFSSW